MDAEEQLQFPGASDGSIVTFERAVRAGSHVIISMEGTSGSGKTYSAIELGRGLVGPNGVLGLMDTETGRGKIYANNAGGYEYGELRPPFSPERYIAGIHAAEEAGIQCLIVDSATHEWEGIGGLIEIADGGKTRDGKRLEGLAKWSGPKARHKRFMQTLLTTRMHLIICLRVKEKMIQREGSGGKQEILSAGWFPVQDKYFGYEMTVRLFFPDKGPKGVPQLAKCPADLLGAFPDGKPISIATGERIAAWVKGGEPVDADFLALCDEAREAAGGGAAVLETYWKRITPSQRKRLVKIGADLRSIADEADREAAESETDTGSGVPSFRDTMSKTPASGGGDIDF